MRLHLVGGFLGSGKTTAIIQAAKSLMAGGQHVGVITNDQGKYLVDTAFFRSFDIPAVEVTGGCFCCNYDVLDGRLSEMVSAVQPDIIFAESVGSCADVVATVVKPLLELGHTEYKPASFSVFTDARMLLRRLQGQEMPFSDEVVYIFDKQIEEAGLVVMNKKDLLTGPAVENLVQLFASAYPKKACLVQSSLNLEGVQPWINRIETGILSLPENALEIDYARYGTGEARLAWLDQAVEVEFPSQGGRALLCTIITRIMDELSQRRAGIGHLKWIVEADSGITKLSIPTLNEPGWQDRVPDVRGKVHLLINARVEIEASALRELVNQALVESGLGFTNHTQDAFHPSQPKPVHRVG